MINKKIQDLHNHSKYSDGNDYIRELVVNAINFKIDLLGISDHYYFENEGQFNSSSLNKYIKDIEALKEEYDSKISIKAGLEVCVVPYPNIFKNLSYHLINKLDYILLENLEKLSEGTALEELDSYLNNIKCDIGLAHTDIYELAQIHRGRGGMGYIIDFMKRTNIFYEINSSSSRLVFDTIIYEPNNPMVKELLENLIKKDIKFSIGSDTHSAKYFEYDRLLKANTMIQMMGGKLLFDIK